MASTEVAPLPYTLVFNGKLQWNGTQEKAISRDYPFALANEALDQYVARNYLQVLWLPESIMPLNILVPLLRRVNAPSSLTSPHPLHDLLEPLLLTVAGVTNKYHNELPQILAAGEGAGEIEETMMWYALEYEKMGDQTDMSSVGNNPDHVGGSVWTNDKWREQYLQRMERREVQIQILLYMFKLSLPGPPPVPDAPSPKKRKRVPRQHQQDPENPIEDHLEAFMDKLSMWQLLGKLDAMASNASKDDRDWMQVFCEDIVEPQFKTQLPSYCALLRSKVFPSSPFSDISSPSSSRSGSPDNSHNPVLTHPHPKHKALSRKTSPLPSRHESALPSVPVLSTTSHRERSKSKSTNTTATTSTSGTTRTKGDSSARALARERSRSLSVSLAQEEEARKRAGSAGVSNKKRVLNKEISMSRVFKPKPKTKSNPIDPGSGSSITGNNNNPNLTNSALDRGVSEANGVERTRVRSRSSIRDEGITLVDDTPVKLRPARTKSSSYSQSCAGTSLGGPSTGTTNSGSGTGSNSGMKRGNEPTLFAMDEEEFWNPPGTSGRFPLRSLSVSGDLSDEDFGSGKEGEGGVEKGSFGNASSTAP